MSPNPFDDHHFAIDTTTEADAGTAALSPNGQRHSTLFATSSPYLDATSPDAEDPFTDLARVPTSASDRPAPPPKRTAATAPTAFEQDAALAAKLTKLTRARRIFAVNSLAWAVTTACYAVFALIQVAGGLTGSLGYHNYLMWVLWFPAFAFLLPALVTTGVFVLRSRARQAVALDGLNMTVRKTGRSPYPLSPSGGQRPAEQVVEMTAVSPFALEDDDAATATAASHDQPPVSPRPDVPRSIRASVAESASGLSIDFGTDGDEEAEDRAVLGRAQRVVVSPTPPQIEARPSEEVRISFDGGAAAWGEEVKL